VGGWLTELFGIRDRWVLDRAFALGHAMQLTNILRDVGEDLERGRLYLPEYLMAKHGVDREFLEAKAQSGFPASSGYRRLLEELMEAAETDYDRAFEAIPFLPRFFQGPVAVAANVYRGIHMEIRRNGFDNLSLRASTSLPRKMVLAIQGLFKLRLASARAKQRSPGEHVPLTAPAEDQGRRAVR
jgi:phytoene synthase